MYITPVKQAILTEVSVTDNCIEVVKQAILTEVSVTDNCIEVPMDIYLKHFLHCVKPQTLSFVAVSKKYEVGLCV